MLVVVLFFCFLTIDSGSRALYQGITLEYLYNHVYDVMFGKGSNFRTVAVKVAFDMFVQATLITLPVAYLAKAAIYRYSPKEAMRRYRDDVMNHGLFTKWVTILMIACYTLHRYIICMYGRFANNVLSNHGALFSLHDHRYASLWGPVMFFTFSFVPEHLRYVVCTMNIYVCTYGIRFAIGKCCVTEAKHSFLKTQALFVDFI